MAAGPTLNEIGETTGSGPWWWVPSLYFAQALPYVLVMTVLTYPYTRLGVSAIVIGYTSWLGLPWTIKPLWSPLVELVGTERRWICTTEFLASAAMAILAVGYMSEHYLIWTLVGYALLAIVSATHDIAADGFYMRALSPHDQTWFAGIRSVAFRGGWIYCEGLLVMLAGLFIRIGYEPRIAWGATHGAAAITFLLLATYHTFVLPVPAQKKASRYRFTTRNPGRGGDHLSQLLQHYTPRDGTAVSAALPICRSASRKVHRQVFAR